MAEKIKTHLVHHQLLYLSSMLVTAMLAGVLVSLFFILSAQAAVTGVTLTDTDTTGYGLDGQDFTVTWSPGTEPAGYQFTQIYITTSGVQLAVDNLDTACGGSMCEPRGFFGQYSMATTTFPPFPQTDSANEAYATSSEYVAWVFVSADTPTIASSSPVAYTNAFDDVADINAPQIMHMSAHAATESVKATLYAMVFDDQTSEQQFANPADGGAEYFKLFYRTNSEAWDSANSSTASGVIGAGELYSFTVPTSSVPAAGGSFSYYLVASDRATPTPNVRYFCASPSATSAGDCQSSPFVVNTVAAGERSVSGKITYAGNINLEGAKVFPAGFASALVTTDGSGDYAIAGLPNNDVYFITATKMGYTMEQRQETVGTSNKTGVNLNLNQGSFGFFDGGDDPGGDTGGQPHVIFSGPQDGMQGVPSSESIRVGFSQSMDATTITTVSSATSSNVYLINSAIGANVPGQVTYCESKSNDPADDCYALFSMDNNTILFNPTSDLATSTQYTLVITGAVKGQSGQSIMGNRPAGGHQITFTTMGNQFDDFSQISGQFGQSGMYMPPFVRSMSPAPGMSVAPNTSVLLEFNDPMQQSTINNDNISLWTSAGVKVTNKNVSASLDSNTNKFVTMSHDALTAGEYEVRVLGAVSNASGLPLRTPTSSVAFSSRFTVAGSSDSTGPTIYPLLSNNSTGVATNQMFEFGFNEQLAFSTANISNISLKQGSTSKSISVMYDPSNNNVKVVPLIALIPNTAYSVTFNATVTDLAGNGVATTTYTYTTGAMDTTAPKLQDARCDDYRCQMFFSEAMNRDSQADSLWANSVINTANWVIERTAPSSDVISITGRPMSYDPSNNSVTIEGVSGLAAGDSYRVTASTMVKDISENSISGSDRIINGTVENSQETFGQFGDMGMFGPPTADMMGPGGEVGQGEFKPMGFGNFTVDQFSMGQADMAFPFNPMAGADSNVFQVRFNPGVAVQTGDQVVITFPNGTTVTNAVFDTQSPFYTDFNQFMAGTVTGTAIAKDNDSKKVTVTLGVSGTPSDDDSLTIDLRKIINPTIPKGPQLGGYTVTIKLLRSGTVLANKTSMPYFIMDAGNNTLIVDVVAGANTSTPTAGADGTVYLHGGGPSGPMDKVLTMANGDISEVDGSAGTSITYSNLTDGCYGIGTEPYVSLGGNDYYGQMMMEQVCLNGGETRTNWILLSPASGETTATVTIKMVDGAGDPYNFGGKDIDIFAGGPNKFVVKTLTGVTTANADGYDIKVNANGHWFVGMGPAMSKGASTGKPASLGVMPPPPVDIEVRNIDTTPVVSLGMPNSPPGVTVSNSIITYTFAAANKTVTGTVKDGSGNALANVEVFMHSQGFGAPVFTQTNASGVFSLSVNSYGNYEIGANSPGMPPVFKNLELRNESGTKVYVNGKNVTGNFTLSLKKPSYTISGKVLDSSNNAIGYAPVMGRDANGNTVFGSTGSDGSYSMFVDSGTWTLRAELPPAKTDSCGTFSKTVIVSGASQASQNITPSAGTCYTLSGTVSVGGTSLVNVPLFIEEWDNTSNRPLPGGLKKGTGTDSNGAYSAKVGGSTVYRIGTWHPDYGELSVTTTVATANKAQNLTVASTDTITFNFTGGTSDMSGFIELKNANDKNKRFGKQLSDLSTSMVFTVQASTNFTYFVDVSGIGKFNGTATAGDTKTIDLGISSGFVTVTGTIYDDNDSAKAGALVTFTNANTTETAVTDSSGEYIISLKAGTYNIAESLSGYVAPQIANVEFTTDTAAYDFGGVAADQPALQTADHNIEGVIFNDGGLVTTTNGYVWAVNAFGTVVSSPIDPSDGSYSLPVTDGDWTLEAVGPMHIQTTLLGAITVDGDDVNNTDITLDPAEAGENVPTSTTGIVTASTGGSMNDYGSGIKMTAGAGVLESGSGDVTLNFEKNYTAPDTETFQALGNASFSIEASGNSTIKTLNGNVEIELDYTDLLASLPAEVSESNLQLAYYSPERDAYVPVEGGFTVDAANNTITGMVNHFTDFVITYLNGDAGVTVTEGDSSTAVTEGGATDSITYVLTSAPTANVIITPSASGSQVSLSPTSMTFTTGNWATPQTLTVTAVDDSSVEGTHSDTITHAISSDDANYAGVSISNITVTITDNDSSGGGGGSFTPVVTVTPPTVPSVNTETTVESTVSEVYILGEATVVSVGASSHTITISSATENQVEVTIESDPITATLEKDEPQDFDTNSDTVKDLRATYLGIVEGKPKLELVNLTDEGELNNALTLNYGAYETTSTQVIAKLNATGAGTMALSNNSSFASSTFISYASSTTWTLSEGNGLKTVYIQFKSTSGGTVTATDTIRLVGQDIEQAVEEILVEPEPIVCSLTIGDAYKYAGNPSVYYITEDCTKRAFKRSDVFFTYFNSWSDVKTVTKSTLDSITDDNLGFMPWGPNYDPKYGALVKIVKDPKVYLLLGTNKHWITSEAVFNSLNYTWNWIEDVATGLLDKYTSAGEIEYTTHHPNHTIIKYADDSKVYRLEPDPTDENVQIKRWVRDEDAFNSLGFRWDRIVTVKNTEEYSNGENLESEGTEEVLGEKISDFQFSNLLSRGDSSEKVKQLQLKLKSLGYFPNDIDANGFFGSITETAVKDFQTANGIDALGFVGPGTRAVLNSL